ncbi:hypothetical protein L9F63_024961 [Diploptera punctata]|uniref:Ionotropic glutamate receptor C-terminal domain-containing protein n=1 Tax=Diploptera punctata TaxID=6984 RepID=A0AAD7ZEB2_DIPPU|nr:hypothetical protein L9F63_024961 [Diploptera punctata]
MFYRCHLDRRLDCTTYYYIEEVILYVPCAKPIPRWRSLTRVFKTSLWLGFIVGYIFLAILIFYSVKYSNKMAKKGHVFSTYTNLGKCFVNLWAVILGISATEDIPHKTTIRIIFILWVMYCFAVNTVYQTFLTSFMVDPGLQHQLSSVEELLESNMEFGMVPSFASLLPDLREKRFNRIQRCNEIQKCLARMSFKGDFATFHCKKCAEYSGYTRYVDSTGKLLFCEVKPNFAKQYSTIFLQNGNFILERINMIILKLHEGGLSDQWWKEMIYTSTLQAARNFTTPPGDYVALSMEHMQSALYIFILGIIVSVICFIVEIFTRKQIKKVK